MLWNGLELPESYFHDDDVYIIKGDCREVLPLMPNKSIDLVLTDPPYFLPNTQFRPEMRKASRMWSNFSFAQTAFEQYLQLFLAKAKDNFEFYLFTDEVSYAVVYPILYRCFYQSKLLVWDKQSIGLGGKWRRQFELLVYSFLGKPERNGGHADIISCARPREKEHPYEKPIDLLVRVISLSQPILVLDPFLGSGGTAIASSRLNRKCIGIEIEERYCELATLRYLKYQATREETE